MRAVVNPGRQRRRAAETAFRLGCLAMLALVVGPVAWLLIGVVARAVPHFRWSVLTTPTVGIHGGLEQAVVGTLVLMVGVLVVAGTVGVLAGLHLGELARPRRDGRPGGGVLRLGSDVLSGFPSIVLGYVGFVALVVGLHWGFSLLPAVLVLSVMVVPYIAKSTETALRQVPTAYREGTEALGMPAGYALRTVVLRSALPGIVTGLLLALAIAGGETAPLIYTAGWTTAQPSTALVHSHGFSYLTYPVFTFYNQPDRRAQWLSYDAALILVVLVLLLVVVGRLLVACTQRYRDGAPGRRH